MPQPGMAARAFVLVAIQLVCVGCTGLALVPGSDQGNPNPTPDMTGATGGGGTSGNPTPEAALDCTTDPGVAPLRRLSTIQYQNTVRDLLAASGLASLQAALGPLLDAVPADSTLTFTTLDNRVTTQHLTSWFNVAQAVGNGIESSATLRAAVAGSCSTAPSLSAACVDTFLDTFGRRALRRPLTAAERSELSGFNNGQRASAEALRAMVVALLMSPAFLNQLEVDGDAPRPSGPLALTAFELASRLSYTYWQTLPDDVLLNAAADGSLLTNSGFQAQLDRVFADPRTKKTLWGFWREWLKLDAFSGFATARPAFKSLTQGLRFGQPGHDYYADMVQEVRDLTEYVTFVEPGSIDTLLSTDVSVTRSTDLAELYGVSAWNGSGAPPRFSNGNRKGLLQRAALIVNNQELTNPFHRGAIIRRSILCDVLPQPDPAALPPGSLDPPPFSATDTTRQRFEKKVAGNGLCTGCHNIFSDLGYVQESYDAIGRFRTTERIFDEQTGALVAELPINATAVAKVALDDNTPVNGVSDLNQRIVDSGKVPQCFARQYLVSAQRRESTTDADKCVERRVAQRLKQGGTLADAFKSIALEPAFRQRTVGAP